MKSISTIAGPLVLLIGTLVSSWLHGDMTNRWGHGAKLRAAEELLSEPLPGTVGDWLLRRENELEPDVKKMLQCEAYVNRIYEHKLTHDVVSVVLLVGPAGPIAVHTPEICYSAQDYAVNGERKKTTLKDVAGGEHSLWDISLKSRELDARTLRVLYGWTTDGAWDATARPRFSYGGVHYLYKLQIAGAPPAASSDFDPCQDFLSEFLTQSRSRLIVTNASAR